jgi:hypothetical protein
VVSFTRQPLYHRVKIRRYSLDRRLGGNQSRSGRGGEEKNSKPPLGIEPPDWMIGVIGFDSRRGLGIFLFTTLSRPALRLTQSPIQWVPRALSLGVKWPGREANHSPPSSSEVKECVELYLHSPNKPSWRSAELNKKPLEQLYLYLNFTLRSLNAGIDLQNEWQHEVMSYTSSNVSNICRNEDARTDISHSESQHQKCHLK